MGAHGADGETSLAGITGVANDVGTLRQGAAMLGGVSCACMQQEMQEGYGCGWRARAGGETASQAL